MKQPKTLRDLLEDTISRFVEREGILYATGVVAAMEEILAIHKEQITCTQPS